MQSKNSITLISNFRIDSQERFSRMKDSFFSFKDANIYEWIINIRGPYKEETEFFLRKNLKQNLKIFNKESKLGWKTDTKSITKYINTSHVMYWVEDHICIGGYQVFNKIISEIIENKIDYLSYSFFKFGKNLNSFSETVHENKNHLILVNYDKKTHNLRSKYINKFDLEPSYLVSMCSITSKELFIDLVTKKDPWIPRWTKLVPFDFEKNQYDVHWLPYKLGVLKQEVFASIDDDNDCFGSSLASRGLYDTNISREYMLDNRNKTFKLKFKLKNQILKYNIVKNIYYNIVKFIIYVREKINSLYAKFFFIR